MTAAHKTMFSSCMARRPTALDKIDEKFLPPSLPPPQSMMGNLRVLVVAVSSLIGWGGGGGLLFYFIPSKIADAVSRGGRMVTGCSSCITYKGGQGHKM